MYLFSHFSKKLLSTYTNTNAIKNVHLFAGDYRFFTKTEAAHIAEKLRNQKVLVMVYDRDIISVPANERAMWIRNHFGFYENLEVRVVYNVPPTTASEDVLLQYVKKQLPKGYQFERLHLNPDNSKTPISKISHDLFEHIHYRHTQGLKDIVDPYFIEKSVKEEMDETKQNMINLNQNHPNQDTLFKRTPWDLSALKKINLPIRIVQGSDFDSVSRDNFSNLSNTQVFDMPFYLKGQGYKLPIALAPYLPFMTKIIAAESLANPKIKDMNAYLTVDCSIVPPKTFARRDGLHIDGFLTESNMKTSNQQTLYGDHTYLASDNPYLQTRCYPGPFDLSGINLQDPKSVLNTFEEQGRKMRFQQHTTYDILRLNTNCVHAVQENETQHFQPRCFIKVTFSERLFNRSGNTINPNLNYRFFYVPRVEGRNTQNFVGAVPTGYLEVDLDLFSYTNPPEWIEKPVLVVCKNPIYSVHAEPAQEGAILETKVDGHVITTNVAKDNDYRITREDGDSYFLSDEKFKQLYQPTEQPNSYRPIPRELIAMKVSKDISFQAPWGTRQNIPKGSYIVSENNIEGESEKWGVHAKSFHATYKLKN